MAPDTEKASVLGRKKSTTTISTIAIKAGDSTRIILAVLKCNDWVQLRIDEMHPNILEVGNNLDEALSYQRQHQDLMNRLQSKQENIEDLLSQADRMVLEQPEPEAAVYEAMADSLGAAWKDLNRQLQLRTYLLEEAIRFFTTVKQHGSDMDNLERTLRDGFTGASNQAEVQRLLEEHDNLRKKLLETASNAMGQGQTVIGRIREIGPIVDNPDRPRQTAEACQRIEDIMLRLNERRKRVEISWEDRRVQLQWGAQASALNSDLQSVLDWLAAAEGRLRGNSDLGNSQLSTQALQKEHEAFCEEIRRHQELLSSVAHTSDQMSRNGFGEGTEIYRKSQTARGRLTDLQSQLENRRQLLVAAEHFFANAAQTLTNLSNVELEIKQSTSGSMSRRPEQRAVMDQELSRKVINMAGGALAQGRAISERVTIGAEGIQNKIREIEERMNYLESLCAADREAAMARSRAMLDFDAEYSNVHLWLLNVAEAFLATYRDMGTTYPASNDFLDRHKHLATDIQNKEPDVMAMLQKGRQVQGQPGDPDYQDVSERLSEFQSRWQRLKQNVERRSQIGLIYTQFHKFAVELAGDIDTLEAMIRTSPETMDKAMETKLEELWNNVGQGYTRVRHEGEKFLADSRTHRVDEDLDIKRAQLCVETLLEHFSMRHKNLNTTWLEHKRKASLSKEFIENWTKFQKECVDTLHEIEKLELEAKRSFGRFEEAPNKVYEKQEANLREFLPRAKRLQQEVENRLRKAENMDIIPSRRDERERLVAQLLQGNVRLQNCITWFEVIGQQIVTFFKNLHQLDEWTRRVEEKFSPDKLPRNDAQQMEDLVREHEGARQTVAQMIKFAHTEGEQIIMRARHADVPREVQQECEKLPDLLNSRIRNWEECWTRHHRSIESFSSTARVVKDITDMLRSIETMDNRLESMRHQAGSSPQTSQMVISEFREFERAVLDMDSRVRSVISMVSARPYAAEPSVREAGETLKQRWAQLKARVQNFNSTMVNASNYFQLLEETEVWIRETTDYISDIGRQSANVQSSADASQLAGKFQNYIQPRKRDMDDRMVKIDTTAISLYGEEAGHRTESVKRRYKEITDTFIVIAEQLNNTVESWRQKEAQRRKDDAPKFIQPLADSHIVEGNRFEFMARVTGRPAPQVIWYKDGVPVVQNPDYETTNLNGVCSLRIEETFVEDSGSFVCRATNEFGTAETTAVLTVKESPLLRMQPPDFVKKLTNANIETGRSHVFECHVSANPTAAVSWFKDDSCVDDAGDYEISYNNGICTLRILNGTESDSGRYVCKAQNPAGQAATSATLVVKARQEPPEFIQYLSEQSILSGDRLYLTAKVRGVPQPEISWQANGRPITNSQDVQLKYDGTTATLNVAKAQVGHEGEYKIFARNAAGSAASNCHVTVTDIQANKPRFVQELKNLTVMEGTTVRLDTVVHGKPAPEVIWYKDEQVLIDNDRCRVIIEGDRTSVFLPSAHLGQSGIYKCLASSKLGTAATICKLIVQKKAEAPRIAPTLQSQTLAEGQRCMMEARVVGEPTPKITWSHNNKQIQSGSSHHQILVDGEWHRLIIARVSAEDRGDYSLLAMNEGGEARSICSILVNEPPKPAPPPPPPAAPKKQDYLTSTTQVVEEYMSETRIQTPGHQTATPPEFTKHFSESHRTQVGAKARLEAVLIGNPRPKVTWSFNGKPIPPGFCQLSSRGDTYIVIIPEVGPEHQGVFTLFAENVRGTAESHCRLVIGGGAPQLQQQTAQHISTTNVTSTHESSTTKNIVKTAPKPNVAAPHFTQTLVSVVAGQSENVNFNAAVTGVPRPEISWTKDGQPLFEGNGVRFAATPGGGIQLVITGASLDHSGKYVCTARNPAGFATSSAQLIVRPKTEAPDFIDRLISKEVGEGDQLRWSVKVCGDPDPTITWLRNGNVIPNCKDVQLIAGGNGAHTLVIPRVETVDGGQFTCRAENVAGEARSTADLVIRPKGVQPGKFALF